MACRAIATVGLSTLDWRPRMPRHPKPPSEVKSIVFRMRLTPPQHDLVVAAAHHEDRDPVDWARRLVLREATKIVDRANVRSERTAHGQGAAAGRHRPKGD